MEDTIPNLRSRSRSKTPLPQQSRDREENTGEHVQGKTGRKTPVISRDTPTRLITTQVETIPEDTEKEVVFTSPPAHRTRNALRQRTTPIPRVGSVTPTFSLDDDDLSPGKSASGYMSEEHAQNVKNYSYEYERITTSSQLWNNARRSSSRQQPSPSGSERSNESFAESVLADSSRLSGSGLEHLPYKVYKDAGEYWNKYPKTDYTYSRLSKDRVELAPGQVAVPNMSRPSLHTQRHGLSDLLYHGSTSSLLGDASDLRQRWTTDTHTTTNSYQNHLRRYESISDTEMDEVEGRGEKSKRAVTHWWITTLIITVVTKIVTTVTTIKNKVLGHDDALRYPYYVTPENYLLLNNRRTKETTWYTKVGETVKRRRWWLLLLLLLLVPFAFLYTNPEYGEKITNYASKSVSNLKFPNVSLPQFHMPDMKFPEFSLPNNPFPEFSLPEVKLPEFSFPKITLPEFALPESFPKMSNMRIPSVEMPEAFYQYKSAASSQMSDFAKYISVLGQNWLNELQKMWSGIIDWLYGGTIASLYPYFMYSSDSKVLPVAEEPAKLDRVTEHFDKHSHNDKFINMERQQGYYERPAKFEITDDLINTIVMRVKASLPMPERPAPQIIERIIEKSNNDFDPSVLTRQEQLINKLTAEINALKALNKNDDEETMSALISKHTTRTIIQLLGLPSNDGAVLSKEDVKLGLLQESKHYVDEQLLGFQQSVSDDLGKIKEGVKKDLRGIHKEIVLSHSASESKPAMHVEVGCQQCDDAILKIVKEALIVYDADKTGLVDYALESAGGQVVSTRCTESYQPNSAVYSLFGIPLWYPSNSPRTVITPGSSPGECWAFKGFPGYLVIKLYKRINVTGFTLEHTPSLLTPHGQIESAPKKFTVWGLQDLSDHEPVLFGSFEYLNDSTPLQYFPADIAEAKPGAIPGHELVEIRVESNHGNPVYSCLYRFRIHGEPVDEYSFYGNGPER